MEASAGCKISNHSFCAFVYNKLGLQSFGYVRSIFFFSCNWKGETDMTIGAISSLKMAESYHIIYINRSSATGGSVAQWIAHWTSRWIEEIQRLWVRVPPESHFSNFIWRILLLFKCTIDFIVNDSRNVFNVYPRRYTYILTYIAFIAFIP